MGIVGTIIATTIAVLFLAAGGYFGFWALSFLADGLNEDTADSLIVAFLAGAVSLAMMIVGSLITFFTWFSPKGKS
jgi:hypothetical protein